MLSFFLYLLSASAGWGFGVCFMKWLQLRIEASKLAQEKVTRSKIEEVNDTILDLATAHLRENRDQWKICHHRAVCAELGFSAWIANKAYGFNFSNKSLEAWPGNTNGEVRKPHSKEAAQRFLAAVHDLKEEDDLTSATRSLSAMIDKIGAVQ